MSELIPIACPFCGSPVTTWASHPDMVEHPDNEGKSCVLNGMAFIGVNKWNQRSQELAERQRGGLIKLTESQERVIEEWAPDADAWGSTEARRINLTTFARQILKGLDAPAELEVWLCEECCDGPSKCSCSCHKSRSI